MRTLILNVDRDNDYGDKAQIEGPVIGYSECYAAAVKLVSIDPEDSDANALFGALIKLYKSHNIRPLPHEGWRDIMHNGE